MPAGICLPTPVIEKFKQALVAGKIVPEKLAQMTSDERHKLFSDIVGEGNAKFVNSTFEAKTLLKDQQRGYLVWAKKLTGVTPEIKRDLITRISKLDHVLAPTEEHNFLKDLASTKLGLDVTSGEAKQIANMSSRLQELAGKQKADGTFPSEADRLAYGTAKVDMGSHLADLKNQAAKVSVKTQLLNHPIQTAGKASGLAKSLRASLDNTAIFRQGWKTLWTNPIKWQRNARASFMDVARQMGGKEALKAVQADIVSRPNADLYQKMKLAIGNVEEEFPSSLPEKVPGLGRLYKASEAAYTGFLYRQRADIADRYLAIAKDSGVNIKDKTQLESIGKLVNALTGRGDLGRMEGKAAGTLNNIFFSARSLKSNVDTLTAHQFQKGVTPFVRKQAAINLVKIVSGTAAVMTVANAMKPGSVELDPRSSDFGKIKVGSTKFDVTGGMGSIGVLAARMIKNQTKSTSTGIITKLGTGFGSQTRLDVVNNFIDGKTAPAATIVKDLLKGQDGQGNKPTALGEAKNNLLPFIGTTYMEAKHDPHGANALLTTIADGLGLAATTSSPNRNLSNGNLTKTEQAFQAKVGTTKFQAANDQYNQKYNDFLKAHQQDIAKLPADQQQPELTAAKAKIQATIYKQNGFKPPRAKADSQTKAAKKSILDSIR